MSDSSGYTVEALVSKYLDWVGKRKKSNTLRSYTTKLAPFRRKFGGRPFTSESLTPLEIDDYLLEVNFWKDGRPKAPDTIRGNVVVLEELQKFASCKLLLPGKVINDLEKPAGRIRDRLPTPEELELLRKHGSRQLVLIYQALRQSGARPNELARATCEHWDRTAGVIVLQEHKASYKSERPRVIPVGEKLRPLIEQSLQGRTEGHLFLAPRGKPWTSAGLSQTFARVRKSAGVDPALKLYSSRHECATALCKVLGRDKAGDILGHANPRTTKRYDHVTTEELRANQDAITL